VFGVCDIDAGKNFTSFKAELNKMGYDQQYKSNETLALAIFYKRAKFELVRTAYYAFEERPSGMQNQSDNEAVSTISFDGAQEMLIWCHLRTTTNKTNKKEFVFLQTHIFKDVSFKLTQVNKYLAKKMQTTPNLPVIVAGNINREPN
jgi:hypothetical protein